MSAETTMMGIFLLLACTLIVLLLSSKINLPTIIGFFVTGIIIGPSGLNLFNYEQVSLVAEFGLILLMFTIGLEISLKKLLEMKKLVLIGGGLQIILTTLFVWVVLSAFGIPSNTAFLLGLMVSASSTAIVLNIYQNNGQIDTRHGKLLLAILISQDIAVIPIMLMLPMIAGTGAGVMASLFTLGTNMIALLVVMLVALVVVPKILEVVVSRRNRELFIISVMTICIGIAWVLSLADVSMSLGAFLAGVAIAGSEYNHEVIGIIMPIRDMMTGIFFISVGMMLSVAVMMENIVLILILVGLLILAKTVIATAAGWIAGATAGTAIIGGLSLAHIGEFSFVLGSSGLSLGILTDGIYQIFLAVAIISMTIAPFAVNAAPKISQRIVHAATHGKGGASISFSTESPASKLEEEGGPVIVVGFGPAGRYVVRALKHVGREYIILEMNHETVAEERRNGEHILYGDASLEPVLQHAGIRHTRTLVITISDSSAAESIALMARRLNPWTTIITRARYTTESSTLFKLGVDEVIADEREAGLAMARRVFANENVPAQDLEQYVLDVRGEMFAEREKVLIQKVIDSKVQKISSSLAPSSKSEFVHIAVSPDSEAAGKALADLHLRKRFHVSVVSLHHASGEVILTPDGTKVLMPEDMLVLSGKHEDLERVKEVFGDGVHVDDEILKRE
ncbi:cation:proton antiporter [Methanorbis furvi]|uniref:Glutathione-regulated potassium-efflux system protein KefB n=1 Tax=Methanorbis furvi TaxID=3028299 RepID=A0AAE4SA71_9EURY|nr:Glutathione-regulated potassium-efflux system protein KefB [Methanocorpusculaceae archaeon Ag1]